MPEILEVAEGLQQQSAAEEISYTLDVTNYPGSGSPSSIVVTVINVSDGSDVTTTVMPTNSPTIAGNIITLSPLKSLTAGTTYHIRIKYTRSGNIFQPYIPVHCPY